MSVNHIAERRRIIAELAKIAGVKRASHTWPDATDPIPFIGVELAGKSPKDWRDDKPYVQELEFYVRLFAVKEEDFERIGGEVEATMERLGYEQSFQYEEPGAGVRQLAARYKKAF